MLTHDKSSHGLWPGELKKNVGKKSQEKQSWTKSHRKKSQYRYLGKYLLVIKIVCRVLYLSVVTAVV
jgi:hypothetical protein